MDGSEGLERRGTPGLREDRELVPDETPSSTPGAKAELTETGWLPRLAGGRIGNRAMNISWRFRMRWRDDGGR